MKNAGKLSYLNGVEVGVFNTFIQNDNALINAVEMLNWINLSIISSVGQMNFLPFILGTNVLKPICFLLGNYLRSLLIVAYWRMEAWITWHRNGGNQLLLVWDLSIQQKNWSNVWVLTMLVNLQLLKSDILSYNLVLRVLDNRLFHRLIPIGGKKAMTEKIEHELLSRN